jgi:hypothetical protein
LSDDRAQRLKAALRQNLKRRKAQARGRETGSGAERPGSDCPVRSDESESGS